MMAMKEDEPHTDADYAESLLLAVLLIQCCCELIKIVFFGSKVSIWFILMPV